MAGLVESWLQESPAQVLFGPFYGDVKRGFQVSETLIRQVDLDLGQEGLIMVSQNPPCREGPVGSILFS